MIALENKDQSLNYESAVHVSSRSWQTADLRGIVIINTPCSIFLYSVLSRKGVRHVTIPRMLFPKQLFFFISLKHKRKLFCLADQRFVLFLLLPWQTLYILGCCLGVLAAHTAPDSDTQWKELEVRQITLSLVLYSKNA